VLADIADIFYSIKERQSYLNGVLSTSLQKSIVVTLAIPNAIALLVEGQKWHEDYVDF
tara:strand:+ start:29510 stop:29683 length:174 start_codon:yes stop_codon:yes gene_type:complete